MPKASLRQQRGTVNFKTKQTGRDRSIAYGCTWALLNRSWTALPLCVERSVLNFKSLPSPLQKRQDQSPPMSCEKHRFRCAVFSLGHRRPAYAMNHHDLEFVTIGFVPWCSSQVFARKISSSHHPRHPPNGHWSRHHGLHYQLFPPHHQCGAE